MTLANAAMASGAEGEAWRARASELTAWTMGRLVNRADRWGSYHGFIDRDGVEHETRTAPTLPQRGKLFFTERVAVAHYRGDRHCRVGLHSTSPDNRSLWGAIDVDCHIETADARDIAAGNRALVRGMIEWASVRGWRLLIEDSNGAGGYHLWLLFDRPAPTADVFALLTQMVAAVGGGCETFPKQSAIRAGGYGNWLRLPGLHPRRPHWSRFVGPHGRWLRGEEAVDALLNAPINSADLLPHAPLVERSPAKVHSNDRRYDNADALERRIVAYLSRLPSLRAGQNRNGVGFRFACLLVRDLKLTDAEALPWLTKWNAQNAEPYPESKVLALLADAHTYGSHSYGEGLSA